MSLFLFAAKFFFLPWVFFFLPWVFFFLLRGFSFYREVFLFAVGLFLFAARFSFLPRGFSFCRESFLFAVGDFLLLWVIFFCREVLIFAVTVVGHRNLRFRNVFSRYHVASIIHDDDVKIYPGCDHRHSWLGNVYVTPQISGMDPGDLRQILAYFIWTFFHWRRWRVVHVNLKHIFVGKMFQGKHAKWDSWATRGKCPWTPRKWCYCHSLSYWRCSLLVVDATDCIHIYISMCITICL